MWFWPLLDTICRLELHHQYEIRGGNKHAVIKTCTGSSLRSRLIASSWLRSYCFQRIWIDLAWTLHPCSTWPSRMPSLYLHVFSFLNRFCACTQPHLMLASAFLPSIMGVWTSGWLPLISLIPSVAHALPTFCSRPKKAPFKKSRWSRSLLLFLLICHISVWKILLIMTPFVWRTLSENLIVFTIYWCVQSLLLLA